MATAWSGGAVRAAQPGASPSIPLCPIPTPSIRALDQSQGRHQAEAATCAQTRQGDPLSEKGNQAAQTSPLEDGGESAMPPNGHLKASETQEGDTGPRSGGGSPG